MECHIVSDMVSLPISLNVEDTNDKPHGSNSILSTNAICGLVFGHSSIHLNTQNALQVLPIRPFFPKGTQDLINKEKDNWMLWSSKRNEIVIEQSTKRTLSIGRLALKGKGIGESHVSNPISNNIKNAMTQKNEIIFQFAILKDLPTNTEKNIFSNDAMKLKNVYPNDAMTLMKINMYSNDAMTYKDIYSNDTMILTNSYFNVSMTLKYINYVLPFSKAVPTYEYIDDMLLKPHNTKSLVTHTTKDIYILLWAQYIELYALYIELYWSSVLLTLWTICTGAMAARSHNLRYKRYSQQPGLQYLAIGHQGADLSSQWRTDPLSPKEEIIHTIWFIGVFVFKDVVAGIAYAGVVYVGVVYSEPQGPAVQSIFVSLLIKNFAPGNVPGNASTTAPTIAPTIAQTIAPTIPPTIAPTIAQTIAPTIGPTIGPTIAPTIAPTIVPAIGPTIAPAIVPDIAPNSAPTTALMTTDSALAVILPIHKNTLETNSIQMESSHPINDAYFNGVDERGTPNRICKLGHVSDECLSNLNPEGDRVSCLPWSSSSMTCTCTAALNNSVLCGPPTAPLACVKVQDAVVRGYKKRLQRQNSQKKDFECACEAEDSSPSSTEMVHTTLNVVSEFKGAAADLVTGRGGGAKPRSQAQSTNAQCPMSQLPLDQVNIQDMAQTNCKANTQTFAQLSCAARNTPATTAPIALITTHPRIQIPSSTVTVDVILCKESKAIFSSATECLCSEDYSHMIPLLEQITQHTCATQHCQALLFRHFGLGLAHYKMADHHEATKHFMEYRSLALRPADISLAHVYLGDISTIKSNYSNAAYHYLEAIHNYGTNNPSTLFKLVMPSVSALYAKQGAALKQTSQMLQAVEAFRNAIHHAPDINSRLPVHNSLGNLFQSMGDYTEALQEYKKAVKLGEELNDLVSLGWAYGNMGNAHLGLHQKDAALHHLKKALALTIEHESTPQAISRAYNNLGTAYQSLEDFKGAEENFNLALDQAVYGNDVAGQARARGNLGNLLMLNKKYERAVEQYSEVFRLSKDRQVLSTANHNRGCAYLEWAEQLRSGQNGTTSGISSNLQVLCNSGTMVPSPGFTPTELYRLGASDLTQAIELCNEVLQSTKGSMQGLSLSVSLIESSSRTFHKLQDCLIGLQQMDEALVVAEQCRARTLGERLLEKMGGGVNHLTPPLSLEQIQYIVKSQEHPVVYLSYTGAKLIVWLIIPIYGHVQIDCRVVEVEKLEKEKFGGKTFDQYVRQSVQEAVVGNDLELFQDVSGSQTSPLIVLFDVVVLPILDLLRKCKLQDIKSLILIPDSYTSLIPFAALHPERNFNNTFGNTFSIQMMPSLLIMGILNEAHPTRAVMYDRRTACVVGNPHIPIFEHNDEEWSLGRLPHATDEAKWISQLLKVQPLLHEQATKVAVVTKLSPAQVIHIATHGSAVSGFLAFAGPDSSNGKPSKSSDILLLPSEVEQMNIKAALVVLSSCDSGRGMVRADGIIGMGRAFLLAGAQSVLTTLWRIPDESAGMFMQFFYQYLVDGLGTTHALQKATLSVRCFRKYSQCTHWGGFQLIGRETYLHRTKTTEEALLAASLGPRCVFPQIAVVEKLEQGLIQTASQPSNVQILLGYEGTELTDPVKTFIHSFYDYFRGGVFWISCRSEEVAAACVKKALEVIDEIELKTHNIAALVVLESIGPDTLTSFSSRREMATFHKLLCHICTHIIATLHAGNNTDLSSIVGQIDTLLIRGSNIIEVEPFSPIHTIQRIVYGHLQKTKCPSPSDEDRVALEILVDITKGSPPVIDIMTSKGMSTKYPESLDAFIRRLVFTLDESEPYSNVIDKQPMKARNCVSFDLWNAINTLADLCELTSYEELFLHCLCIFHNVPVPKCVLEGLSCLIKRSYSQLTSCQEMYQKLVEFNLLKSYPHPVVLCPTGGEVKEAPPCYGVAPVVATAIWNGKMNDTDKVMALGIVYRVFEDIYSNRHILSSSELQHVFGLVCVVLEVCNCICYLIGEECYQLFYLMLERFKNICNALS